MNKRLIFALAIITLVLLSGCASYQPEVELAQQNACMTQPLAGFWWGLWNGMTAFPAFIGRYLFDLDINFYEACNNGGWYWFGFLVGAGSVFGSGSAGASNKK